MSDTAHVSTLSLETLLVRAIEQRNGAACHEILRRKIEQAPISLKWFIGKELFGISQSELTPTDLSDNPDAICQLARQMLADGFTGQTMKSEPERAAIYIEMAAENPNVMKELPETGVNFWKAADFAYRYWKKMNRRGG